MTNGFEEAKGSSRTFSKGITNLFEDSLELLSPYGLPSPDWGGLNDGWTFKGLDDWSDDRLNDGSDDRDQAGGLVLEGQAGMVGGGGRGMRRGDDCVVKEGDVGMLIGKIRSPLSEPAVLVVELVNVESLEDASDRNESPLPRLDAPQSGGSHSRFSSVVK